jgi:hypothetical protein
MNIVTKCKSLTPNVAPIGKGERSYAIKNEEQG